MEDPQCHQPLPPFLAAAAPAEATLRSLSTMDAGNPIEKIEKLTPQGKKYAFQDFL